MASGRRVACPLRSLVNSRDLHETFLVPVLMYGSETMLWKERERSRIRGVQMDNLKGFWVLEEWIKSQMFR